MSVQLTRDEVRQAWRSFFALRRNGRARHNAPGFRPKSCFPRLSTFRAGSSSKADVSTLSLGTGREDGVRSVTFRISHRPGVEYERVREVSITYDKLTGHLEARLVVEVKSCDNHGSGRAAVDLGETVLLAATFEDGTALIYSGRLVKAIRRYWQKVRAKVKPPSKERPRKSRRYRQIARRERRQVEHLPHIVTSHFIRACVKRGVGEIAIGGLTGIRDGIDYGGRMKERLHAWPYRKIIDMIRYKAALLGIAVRDDVDERGTSRTCHACSMMRESSRVHRGLYRCPCGWTAQADVSGALNIYERAFQVSPVKGSSGRVAWGRGLVIPTGMAYGPRTEAEVTLRAHPLEDATEFIRGRTSPLVAMQGKSPGLVLRVFLRVCSAKQPRSELILSKRTP